jgi:hypothetical protein
MKIMRCKSVRIGLLDLRASFTHSPVIKLMSLSALMTISMFNRGCFCSRVINC